MEPAEVFEGSKEKLCGLLFSSVMFLHNNVKVHKATKVQTVVLVCESHEKPSTLQAGLAPSDCFLFRQLEKNLQGYYFQVTLTFREMSVMEGKTRSQLLRGRSSLPAKRNKCIDRLYLKTLYTNKLLIVYLMFKRKLYKKTL